jgi:hypothetical protein
MIQINAGSFSYMAAGQYAAIGRCLWKCERPRQEVEPAPGPRCPTSTFGGSRSGAMVKHPLEHSSSSALQSIRVLHCWSRTRRRGPQACFAKPNIGVALLGAAEGRNIRPSVCSTRSVIAAEAGVTG